MFPVRGAGPRLFPGIATELLRSEKARGPDQESAARLLTFVDRRFTLMQRVLGWNLDPETRLGRVILLRRQAFEAERAAAFRRADCLWVESHRALRRAVEDADVWRHALAISRFSPSITPSILRERFIQELFIDLHRAVFDSLFGAAESPPSNHRLFVHCMYVEHLVDLAGFDAAKSAPLLRPMFDTWLDVCRRTGAWKRGVAICTRLAERFSPSGLYIDELVVCLLQQTFECLTKPPASFGSDDAGCLKAAIRRLERVVGRLGPTGLGMAGLARLHQMRAVALGNMGARAEALVEIATALDHGGHDPQFHQALRDLTHAMEEDRADVSLGPDEKLLMAEALRGFEPMRAYRASADAARTREVAGAITAIDLWRRIGLPRPADAWPTRALALSEALTGIVRHPPSGPSAVAASWQAASADHDMLRDLPSQPVEAFLVRRLFLKVVPGQRVHSLQAARARLRERSTEVQREAGA